MVDEFDPKHGQLVGIPFFKADLVTAASNTDMAFQSTDHTLVTMPKAGSVVGISVRADAAITAGTITFRAHKAGTEFAQNGYPAPVLSTAATPGSQAVCTPRNLTFAAGDGIGVSYSTSTDMAPSSTNDVTAMLWVIFDKD